jgi:hypothetical protein
MIYYIFGVPCIELASDSEHEKAFYYGGKVYVKLSDYYQQESA